MADEIKTLRRALSSLRDEVVVLKTELNLFREHVSEDIKKLVEFVKNDAK